MKVHGRGTITAKRIDTDVDLKWEAIAGFVLLFALAGIGFSRLDQANNALHKSALSSEKQVRAGIYVIAEIPEASPITDASAVFRSRNLSGVAYSGPDLQWATFTLRLCYEFFLVVVALRFLRVLRRVVAEVDTREIEKKLQNENSKLHGAAFDTISRLVLRGEENAIRLLVRTATSDHRRVGARRHNSVAVNRIIAADILTSVGEKYGRSELLSAAADAYSDLSRLEIVHKGELFRAQANLGLGKALTFLAQPMNTIDAVAQLNSAIGALHLAIHCYSSRGKETQFEWMQGQVLLGLALGELANRCDGKEKTDAMIASADALKTAEDLCSIDDKKNRAVIYVNLGNELMGLAGCHIDDVQAAITYLQEALDYYEKAVANSNPDDPDTREYWGAARSSVGSVYGLSSVYQHDPENKEISLRAAMEATADALRGLDEEETPLKWATALNNHATWLMAYGETIKGEDGIEFLRKAAEYFMNCQRVYTEDEFPLEYAKLDYFAGIAFEKEASLENNNRRVHTLTLAAISFDYAALVYRQIREEEWAEKAESKRDELMALAASLFGKNRLSNAQHSKMRQGVMFSTSRSRCRQRYSHLPVGFASPSKTIVDVTTDASEQCRAA